MTRGDDTARDQCGFRHACRMLGRARGARTLSDMPSTAPSNPGGAAVTGVDEPVPAPTVPSLVATDAEQARRVVFVVGSGRSGTSTMSGTLQTLGVHVPQPEVTPDATNPKGFGEPQWVVDFHTELLKRCQVHVSDARPAAWFEAGKLATDRFLRERVDEWLAAQFAEGGSELVIKDPRLSWFMGQWRSAAVRAGAVPSFITMLRPVTEVVGSKQLYYASRFGEVGRTAAWVNMMLHTERATRGSQRAFVRYDDLLGDWTIPVFEIGERFDLAAVKMASANDIRKVHNFIDPGLHRVSVTWDEIRVPAPLKEIAQQTWERMATLADDGGDTPETRDALDELRTGYTELYEESEALVQSSVLAAQRAARTAAERDVSEQRRLVDRVPHSVRATIPPGARRAIRKAFGRAR